MLVYLISNPISGRSYIGATAQPVAARWWKHLSDARKGSRLPMHRAIRKYGASAFILSVLCYASSKEQLFLLEQAAIAAFRAASIPLYNVTDGGEGAIGYRHTPATIAAWQQTVKARPPEVTAAIVAKVAAANRGQKRSLESRAKMRVAKLGVPQSAEHRRNKSIATRGKPHSESHRRNQNAACTTPEYRSRMSATIKAWWAKRHASSPSRNMTS